MSAPPQLPPDFFDKKTPDTLPPDFFDKKSEKPKGKTKAMPPTDYLGFAGQFAKEMFRPRPQVSIGAAKGAAASVYDAVAKQASVGLPGRPAETKLRKALEPSNLEQQAGAYQETAAELLPVASVAARGALALREAIKDGPGLIERTMTGLAKATAEPGKKTQFLLKGTPVLKGYYKALQDVYGPDLGKMSKLKTGELAAQLYKEATGKLPGTAQEQVDAVKALRAALKPETKTAARAGVKPPPIRPGRSFAAPEAKPGVPPPVKYTGRFKEPAEAEAVVESAAPKPKAKPAATHAGTPDTDRPEPPTSVRSGHAGENTPALRGAAEDVVHRNAQAKDLKMVEYFKSKGIDPDTISDAEFNKHLAANGFKPAPAKYDPKLLRRAMSAVRADIRALMKTK